MKQKLLWLTLVPFVVLGSGAARAEIISLECAGFPPSPHAGLINHIQLDTVRQVVKSLDTAYVWSPATFTEDQVNWVSHGRTGAGEDITRFFAVGRANLQITQTIAEGGRAVYNGVGQCQKVATPQNQF